MVARAAFEFGVDGADLGLAGAAGGLLQVGDVEFLDQQADAYRIGLACEALPHQSVVQFLQTGVAELPDAQASRRIGQAVVFEQREHRVHVRLLGAADVVERAHPPVFVLAQLDVAGDLLFFAHQQQVVAFPGGQRRALGRGNVGANLRDVPGARLPSVRALSLSLQHGVSVSTTAHIQPSNSGSDRRDPIVCRAAHS